MPHTTFVGASTREKARSLPQSSEELLPEPAQLQAAEQAPPGSPFPSRARAATGPELSSWDAGQRCQPLVLFELVRSRPSHKVGHNPHLQALACCQAPGGLCHNFGLGLWDPTLAEAPPGGLWLLASLLQMKGATWVLGAGEPGPG